MDLAPGFQEHRRTARFDSHCHNGRLYFHRTRKSLVTGSKKKALLDYYPIKRTTCTVWPVATNGIPISSATSAICSITTTSCRPTCRRAQHRLLCSRGRYRCGRRSSVAPSTASCAITSALAASPTVSGGVTTPSVRRTACSCVNGAVRVAEEATIGTSTLAVR